MSKVQMHQLKDRECRSGAKHDPTVCCHQGTHFKYKYTYSLKVNGWRKIYHANTDQKKSGVTILISDSERCNTHVMGTP